MQAQARGSPLPCTRAGARSGRRGLPIREGGPTAKDLVIPDYVGNLAPLEAEGNALRAQIVLTRETIRRIGASPESRQAIARQLESERARLAERRATLSLFTARPDRTDPRVAAEIERLQREIRALEESVAYHEHQLADFQRREEEARQMQQHLDLLYAAFREFITRAAAAFKAALADLQHRYAVAMLRADEAAKESASFRDYVLPKYANEYKELVGEIKELEGKLNLLPIGAFFRWREEGPWFDPAQVRAEWERQLQAAKARLYTAEQLYRWATQKAADLHTEWVRWVQLRDALAPKFGELEALYRRVGQGVEGYVHTPATR